MRPVLAGIYRTLGNPQPGIEHIQVSILANPDDPSYFVYQADLLSDVGKTGSGHGQLDPGEGVF